MVAGVEVRATNLGREDGQQHDEAQRNDYAGSRYRVHRGPLNRCLMAVAKAVGAPVRIGAPFFCKLTRRLALAQLRSHADVLSPISTNAGEQKLVPRRSENSASADVCGRWRDRLPLSLSLDTIGDESLADATAGGTLR